MIRELREEVEKLRVMMMGGGGRGGGWSWGCSQHQRDGEDSPGGWPGKGVYLSCTLHLWLSLSQMSFVTVQICTVPKGLSW